MDYYWAVYADDTKPFIIAKADDTHFVSLGDDSTYKLEKVLILGKVAGPGMVRIQGLVMELPTGCEFYSLQSAKVRIVKEAKLCGYDHGELSWVIRGNELVLRSIYDTDLAKIVGRES